MNADILKQAFGAAGHYVAKHAPEFLLGFGIAGTCTATVLAAKAAPKAEYKLRDAQKKKGDVLTLPETVKTVWKDYAPAVAIEAAAIACIVAGGTVQHKRNASLAAAYSLTASALSEYVEKVTEEVGEKKAAEIQKEVENAHIRKMNPHVEEAGDIPIEKTRYVEPITGQVFYSSPETLKEIVNKLNYELNNDRTVTLNQLLDELDLTNSNIGDDLGWCIEKGLLEMSFRPMLDSDNNPCAVFSLSQPRSNVPAYYIWY